MKHKIFIYTLVCASFLAGCNMRHIVTMPDIPTMQKSIFVEASLINEAEKDQIETTLSKSVQSIDLELTISPSPEERTPAVLKGSIQSEILAEYAKFRKIPILTLAEDAYYTIEASPVPAGKDKGKIKVSLKDYEKMPYGTFYIPVVVKADNTHLVHFVKITKEGEYVPLSDDSPKPLPPGHPDIKKPLKMIAYIETNDWNPVNMGQFILKDSKQPVFDMVVFFAPNMNYDSQKQKRYIFFNQELQPIVQHPEIYIKPLTDRGIKVIFEILPNHQGVGYSNFQSYEDALEFAKEAKMWTDKLGIDGWDIDEEYARYDKRPELPTKGSKSFMWYMRAMKEVMPDKLLTLYDFGHGLSYNSRDEFGKRPSDYIDFSFSDYGVNNRSSVGLPNERFAARSVEANRRGLSPVEIRAKRNLHDKFGGLMIFGLRGDQIRSGEATRAFSKATMLFYGQECVFSGGYIPGPKDRK